MLSTLDFCHSSHARLLPAVRSVLYFACHAEHVLWNYGSRVGQTQSFTTTLKTLRTLARQNAMEITRLGVDVDRWFISRFDNVQEQSRQYEQRIGRENTMHIGVAGTVAEVEDFIPSAADLDDRLVRIQQGHRKDLTVEKLLGMIDFDHLDLVASFQWLQTLVNHIPSLYCYKKDISKAYRDSVCKFLIPTKKTCIHTLAPVAKNEAVTTDLRDTLVDFLAQLGQHEDSYVRRLALMGGDGLTFEKIIKVKQYLQAQDSEFQRLDLVMPFLETWHAQWTYLCSLFEVHFDSSLSPDPSKLGHSMTKIDQKAPSNLKRVEYYKGCFAAYKTLEVRQLDCWRCVGPISLRCQSNPYSTHNLVYTSKLRISLRISARFLLISGQHSICLRRPHKSFTAAIHQPEPIKTPYEGGTSIRNGPKALYGLHYLPPRRKPHPRPSPYHNLHPLLSAIEYLHKVFYLCVTPSYRKELLKPLLEVMLVRYTRH